MKKVYIFTTMILLATAFILCGVINPSTVSAQDWKWPKSLIIATQAQQSPMYAISVGWSSVLEKERGTKVRVTPEDIGAQRLRYVATGRFDMCTEEGAGIKMGIEGVREHATRDGGPFPVRILWTNFLNAQAIMIRGDSKIKSMADLKPGLKAGVHPGAGPRETLKSLIAYSGLEEKDINIIEFGSMEASMRSVVDGKTDFCGADPGHPLNIEFESSPHGIRYLTLKPDKNPEGIKGILRYQPTAFFGKPILSGKAGRDIIAIRQGMVYLGSAEKTDPELAYNLAKWIDQNYDAYKGMHPTIKCMSMDSFRDYLDNIYFPVHEGVIRYLKEKGVWTAEDEERQAYNTKLVDRYIAAYKGAIRKADAKKIKVSPENKAWMDLWAEEKKDIPIFKVAR